MFAFSLYAQDLEVVEKENITMWVVAQKFTGDYEAIKTNMKIFVDEFLRQKLVPHPSYPYPIGIFHANGVWELGFRVQSQVRVENPLHIRKITFPTIVESIHRGSYRRLLKTKEAMVNRLPRTRLEDVGKPAIVEYLDNPDKVEEGKLRSRILLPVKKS